MGQKPSILSKLKQRSSKKWKELLAPIKCPATRDKTIAIVWWDFYSDTDKKSPKFMKDALKRFSQELMDPCISETIIHDCLIAAGYPAYLAKRRSVVPSRNPEFINNERKNHNACEVADQKLALGLCPFSGNGRGALKKCVYHRPPNQSDVSAILGQLEAGWANRFHD